MKEQECERNANDKTEVNSRVQLFIDKPVSWLFAQVIAILGILAITVPLFFGSKEQLFPGIILVAVTAATMILSAVIILRNSRAINVVFDVCSQVLLVERKTFFGDVSTERYHTCNIREIKVDEKQDSESSKTYQLQLELDDHTCVPLSTGYVYSSEVVSSKTEILREVVFGSGRSLEKMLSQKRRREKPPLPVLLIVFIVLATPFGAHYCSRMGDLPRITVETGVPTPDVLSLVQDKAASVLESGEKVLWVGQPQLGREEEVKGWWTIGFAYIWTLFSIFWCFAAVGFSWKNVFHPIRAIFLLFGLPFVGIGFTLLLLPYFSYKDDLETVYVITDRAAIQIKGNRAFHLVKFDSKDFGPLKITDYSSTGSIMTDRADLLFVSSVDDDGMRRSYSGFWGVSDYKNVISILQSHGVGRAR